MYSDPNFNYDSFEKHKELMFIYSVSPRSAMGCSLILKLDELLT